MVWGAAALTLRAASEVIGFCIFIPIGHSYRFNRHFIFVVSLHFRLVVYVVSTITTGIFVPRLAMVLQRSPVSFAVDRYGRETSEESDRDFSQIRLSDTP